jgi:seryl-tRNA synthetase
VRGFVPDDGAQHKTVVEMTSAILGDQYRTLTDQFETMRRKRNEMTYEAGALLSKSEAQKAFSDAIALVKRILAEVKSQNPQFELKFELKEK